MGPVPLSRTNDCHSGFFGAHRRRVLVVLYLLCRTECGTQVRTLTDPQGSDLSGDGEIGVAGLLGRVFLLLERLDLARIPFLRRLHGLLFRRTHFDALEQPLRVALRTI